jgi:NTP pyrophosphatase (non-canonical NTP hydrolase)
MEIKQAQNQIKEVLGKIQHPKLASYIALTEEVGELANEILKLEIYEETKDKTLLEQELADVFVCVLELANIYQIDLEKALENKIETLKPRAIKWENQLTDLIAKKRQKHD